MSVTSKSTKMLKGSFFQFVLIYGLLITTVLGAERDSDSCGWMAIGAGLLAGAGAVVAAPLVLTAAGFTSAGVAAGSIAAAIQTTATASGSAFALAQSAGAAGLAVGTKVAVGGAAGAAGYKTYKAVKGCNEPDCD